jgi:hypothetical protein
LWIAVIGVLLPQLAVYALRGSSVLFRDRQFDPRVDAELLSLPIHVLSFDTANDTLAVVLMLAAVVLIGVSGLMLFTHARRALSFGMLVTLQAVGGVTLALAPVSFNPDPTVYVLYARLYGVFGINPYHAPIALPHDSLTLLLAPLWGDTVPANVYGPLWTLFVGAVAHVQADAPLAAQWVTQRLIAVTASIVAAWGIYRILRRSVERSQALARVAHFAFHPLVLLETAVNGHNDMVMTACGVWAFALLEAQPLLAGAIFGAAVAVKFVVIIIAPFFLVMLWRTHADGRARAALLATLGAGVVFAASFAPFWFGVRTLASIPENQSGVAVSPAALLAHRYMDVAGIGETDPVFPGQRQWHIFRHATAGQLIDLGLVALWLLLAFVLWYRFTRTGERSNAYLTLVGFFAAMPAVGAYYFIWLSPILAEQTPWGTYARWLLLTALAYYAQNLLGHLSWNRTSDTYVLALMVVPLAAVFARSKRPA